MSFAKRFNTPTATFTFEMDGKDLPYTDLRTLAEQNGMEAVYQVKMLYINKGGRFGDAPCIVTPHNIVNAPHHMLDTVKEILTDTPSVNLINDGYVGFKLYSYKNKFGQQYAVEWVDIADPENHVEPEQVGVPF